MGNLCQRWDLHINPAGSCKPVIKHLQICVYVCLSMLQHLTLFLITTIGLKTSRLTCVGFKISRGPSYPWVLVSGHYKALGSKCLRLCRACSLYCKYSSLKLQQESSPRNACAWLCARKPLQYQVMSHVCWVLFNPYNLGQIMSNYQTRRRTSTPWKQKSQRTQCVYHRPAAHPDSGQGFNLELWVSEVMGLQNILTKK